MTGDPSVNAVSNLTAPKFRERTSSRILRSAIFLAAFCKAGNVVDGSAFTRIDVSEIRGVQQNDLGPEFIRERNRVAKTFP